MLTSLTSNVQWMDMFETLCARYHCRSVECLVGDENCDCGAANASSTFTVAPEIYFISGPGGKWLAEVASITLERSAGSVDEDKVCLSDQSRRAIMKLVRHYENSLHHNYDSSIGLNLRRNQLYEEEEEGEEEEEEGEESANQSDNEYEIVFDWFIFRHRYNDRGNKKNTYDVVDSKTNESPTTTARNSCNAAATTSSAAVFNDPPLKFMKLQYLNMMCDEIVEHPQRRRDEERRQCLIRIDQNNRIVTLIVLRNTTYKQALSSISASCNMSIEHCLRPFVLILACELTTRGVTYDNMNLHRMTEFTSQCWLTKAREMHKFAKWVRIVNYEDAKNPVSIMRDRILCVRSSTGRLHMIWRNGCVLPTVPSTNTFAPTMHILPEGAIFDLSRLAWEIRCDERGILSLCDFDVFQRRCEGAMATTFHNPEFQRRSNVPEVRSVSSAFSVATDLESNTTDAVDCNDCYISMTTPRHAKLREFRYFVNSNNMLVRRPFVSLS